jgi:hypothetical protein
MADTTPQTTPRQGNGSSAAEGAAKRPEVRWNDANMKSSYANVVNVSSTREEVSLFFGTNQSWNTEKGSVNVSLDHRIILNPFAAKRLSLLLSNLLRQYESRFGTLDVEARERPEQV